MFLLSYIFFVVPLTRDHFFNLLNGKKMKDIIKTWCPLFPGFYGTHFEPDYLEEMEIEHINNKREEKGLPAINSDSIIWEYKDYRNSVGKEYCGYMEERLKEIGVNVKIEFESIYSPKYYNFSNDSINCTIHCDWDKIIELLEGKWETCYYYFKNKFSSRPGFISFYPYNKEFWVNTDVDDSKIATKCGSILEAFLTCLYSGDESLGDLEVMVSIAGDVEGPYATNYDELIKA